MANFLKSLTTLVLLNISIFSLNSYAIEPKEFIFQNDPIDVIIPCTEKDKETLELCIQGIKLNCSNIRRILVISPTHLTNEAEWIDETQFPITKDMIAFELFRDAQKANTYKATPGNRLGWIYQQIIKLYVPLVIKNISSNVLALDADTIFLQPVSFTNTNGATCFNPGTEWHLPYFKHMTRLLPFLHRVYPQYSGISHHMLFQKCLLEDLQATIEQYHNEPMWKALLHCIDAKELFGSCLSEYEIYFNYALLKSNQFTIRKLKWNNVSCINCFEQYRKQGYHYVSAHSYYRKK